MEKEFIFNWRRFFGGTVFYLIAVIFGMSIVGIFGVVLEWDQYLKAMFPIVLIPLLKLNDKGIMQDTID